MSLTSSSDDDDLTIGRNHKVSLGLEKVRDLTTKDPVINEEPDDKVVAEDVVRVTSDNWRPSDYRYNDNDFQGAIVAAETVVEREQLHPTLQIGAEFLDDHRQAIKDMAERQVSHIPTTSDGVDRREEHRQALRRLVRDG